MNGEMARPVVATTEERASLPGYLVLALVMLPCCRPLRFLHQFRPGRRRLRRRSHRRSRHRSRRRSRQPPTVNFVSLRRKEGMLRGALAMSRNMKSIYKGLCFWTSDSQARQRQRVVEKKLSPAAVTTILRPPPGSAAVNRSLFFIFTLSVSNYFYYYFVLKLCCTLQRKHKYQHALSRDRCHDTFIGNSYGSTQQS